MNEKKIARCLGCGCDDNHACTDPWLLLPCAWLRVDYAAGVGVCSACPELTRAWDRGERRAQRARQSPQ